MGKEEEGKAREETGLAVAVAMAQVRAAAVRAAVTGEEKEEAVTAAAWEAGATAGVRAAAREVVKGEAATAAAREVVVRVVEARAPGTPAMTYPRR